MTSEFTVLGLLGPAGSGKDLVADWFVKKGFVKIAFADPMKRFTARAFGIDQERLWGPSEKRNELFDVDEAWWFEVIGHFGDAADEIVNGVLEQGDRVQGYLQLHDWLTRLRQAYRTKISARVILQTLGTEWGRALDGLLWAKYTQRIIEQLRTNEFSYNQYLGLRSIRNREIIYQGAIIPDHRFRNEVDYTHDNDGYVIRLRRTSQAGSEAVGIAGHQSESEQKELPDDMFRLVLNFPEGVDKVHEMLEQVYAEKLWARQPQARMHYL